MKRVNEWLRSTLERTLTSTICINHRSYRITCIFLFVGQFSERLNEWNTYWMSLLKQSQLLISKMCVNFTTSLDFANFFYVNLNIFKHCGKHQFKNNPRNQKLLSFRLTLSHILNFFLIGQKMDRSNTFIHSF